MSIKILITGGSGFIGSNLMEFYLNKKYDCLNLDVLPPKNESHMPFWRQLNMLDYELLKEIILNYKPTHVLHMAARTDIFENKNINGYAINFEGVRYLIEILNECSSVKRVIFSSSMLVCRLGYSPKDYNDYCPPNLYGESKVIMEKIIKKANAEKYEWIIIRPTSIWGPWFKSPYKDFFDLVKRKKYVKFTGKSSTKTFGFIYNSIYQIDKLLFLDAFLVNKKTFYIGDNPPININEWADEIGGQLGIKIVSVPFPIIKIVSLLGDVLMTLKIKFPLYSFRLKNMTTNNIIELLDDTIKIVPDKPFSMEEGTVKTLAWIKVQDNLS